MQLRKRRLFLFIVAVLLLAASPADAAAATTIHVVERATTDAVTNGSKEDRVGNVLTWHNKIYDAQNKQLVLLLLPDGDTVKSGKEWQPAFYRHQRLVKLLQEHQLAVVDTRAALREHGGANLFYADSVHYTAEGNRIIAQQIAEFLGKNGSDRVQVALRATAGGAL